MPETSIQEPNAEALQHSSSVEIKPNNLAVEDLLAIKPKYKRSVKLVQAFAHYDDNDSFDKNLWAASGFKRNPALDTEEYDGINPKEIADYNFKEMARATSQKWYVALHRMFKGLGKEIEFPLHAEDGRMKIVIPGGHLAFETGGILRFFNEQHIPVDIDVVDIDETGQELDSMDLDALLDAEHSTINFHPNTNARDFLKERAYDLAILRSPGPVWLPEQLSEWKGVTDAVNSTDPTAIILSTYSHEIEDPQVKEAVGLQDKETVREDDIFNALLEQNGYREGEQYVMDDFLRYPLSIYMTSFQIEGSKMKWDMPVDRFMDIYYKPGLLPSTPAK